MKEHNNKQKIIKTSANYLDEKGNVILQKMENFQTKIALCKIRKIIIKEMKKDYYQNAANIREFIDINTHPVDDYENNRTYMHIENMCIWLNGFYTFNRFNQTYGGYRISRSKDKKQSTVPLRRKKLICKSK